MKTAEKINGTQVTGLHTIGSMYANGNVNVNVNGETWRIHVSELVKMFNEFDFEVYQNTKYKYLINPTLREDIK